MDIDKLAIAPMEELIDELKDLALRYHGVFQIRYYGDKALSSVSFTAQSASIKIKYTGDNLEDNLRNTIHSANKH